jgi:hypothetical protein
MEVSEARVRANQANAQKSTGPKTDHGKSISRRNGLKHGLTGLGIVVTELDRQAIQLRSQALESDLKPRSIIGQIMIGKLATLSLRSERSAELELSMIASKVRNAVEDFDQERHDRVDNMLDGLSENPRYYLRKLRRMPEGVDALLVAWRALRDDLAVEGRNCWGVTQLMRAAILSGVRDGQANSSPIGLLSNAIWGDFFGLTANEGGDLDDEARRAWARGRLMERIDATIAELEAHRQSLDLDRIERDRLEAPERAVFDGSKDAALVRRYEADADRGFYKALNEFRKAEAEATAKVEEPSGVGPLDLAELGMGSSCDDDPLADRERALAFLDLLEPENPVVRGSDGLPLSITRPSLPPR